MRFHVTKASFKTFAQVANLRLTHVGDMTTSRYNESWNSLVMTMAEFLYHDLWDIQLGASICAPG